MYDKSDIVVTEGEMGLRPENEELLDVSTGILLTPSFHGENCLGNGEHFGYECCCDECDYYLLCFPDWNQEGFGEEIGR